MRGMTRAMMWALLASICLISRPAAGGPQSDAGVQVDKSSIGGVVLNSTGGKPEAGVWVIAETKLSVPYRKIVVTDDQGRFLVPDLPDGAYELWVRGYGLKDSEPVKAVRGGKVKLLSCQRRNSAGSGEDLSCQLLDVADSASIGQRSPRQVQDLGRMAWGPEERVQPLP